MTDVTGLAGIILSTSPERFEAMAAFYIEALGLDPRSIRPGFVNFDLGEQRLTVALHSEVAGVNPDPTRILVNFSTADVDAAAERLRSAGTRIVRPPEMEKWGGRILTVADPDGNLIQLLEIPD